MRHATTQVNVKNMLSERSQITKHHPCIVWFHLGEMSRIGKSTETENKWLLEAMDGNGES